MKKFLCTGLVLCIVGIAPLFALAGEDSDVSCPMMGKGMMKMMRHATMIETKDGGIVVMVGNKLLKYDRNLNLVKEAEIPIDMDEMVERCMTYKKKMMRGPMMMPQGAEAMMPEASSQQAAPEASSQK